MEQTIIPEFLFGGEREFSLCFLEGNDKASLTSSIRKFSNKARKLAEKYPNETSFVENSDRSVYFVFPVEWIKFPSPKKKVSEENKQKASERLKEARKKKANI